MIFVLSIIGSACRPISRELQVACLVGAAGLAGFGIVASLGFGVEIGQCLALE